MKDDKFYADVAFEIREINRVIKAFGISLSKNGMAKKIERKERYARRYERRK